MTLPAGASTAAAATTLVAMSATRRPLTAGKVALAAVATLTTVVPVLAAAGMVPAEYAPHDLWIVTIGTLATLVIGFGASLVVGKRKTTRELRGLVFGCGSPGVLASEEEVTVIGDIEPAEKGDSEEDGVRWK